MPSNTITGNLVNELETNDVVIYPNPVKHNLHVELGGFAQNVNWMILNVQGFKIKEGESTGIEINQELSHLQLGNYTLIVTDGNKTSYQRFIKEE